MVARIVPKHGSTGNALEYNERKVKDKLDFPYDDDEHKEENAEDDNSRVLAIRGADDLESLREEFDRLKMMNLKGRRNGRKLQYPAFHMSLNPGEEDAPLTDEQMIEIADKIMSEMGYGDQPYVVFAHEDIPRHHVHIVSTRIGRDGKKIDDAFEQYRLMRTIEKLGKEYGFKLGLGKEEKEQEKTENKKQIKQEEKPVQQESQKQEGKAYVLPFSRKSELPVRTQMKNALEDALRWHFSTEEQFKTLMRARYNIDYLEMEHETRMYGLNGGNERCTNPINVNVIDSSIPTRVKDSADSEDMKKRRRQRERLEQQVREAMESAESDNDFRTELRKRGIIMVVSWNRNNEPFGITWIDRATRCIWKASDTSMTLESITNGAKEKGWSIEKDRRLEAPVHDKRPAARIPKRAKPTKTGFVPAAKTLTPMPLPAIDKKPTAARAVTGKSKQNDTTRRSNAQVGGHDKEIWEDEAKKHLG